MPAPIASNSGGVWSTPRAPMQPVPPATAPCSARTAVGRNLKRLKTPTPVHLRTAPPTPKTASPKISHASGLEANVRELIGCDPINLSASDLRRHSALQAELRQFSLSDYFDQRGSPRFGQAALSFAAKHSPHIRDTFGSTLQEVQCDGEQRTPLSLTATKLAEMTSRASVVGRGHAPILKPVAKKSTLSEEDVVSRQLTMMFAEVPDFEAYLPKETVCRDLLPIDAGWEADLKQRRYADHLNAHFRDPRNLKDDNLSWLLDSDDLVALTELMMRWQCSTRGALMGNGMDRASFCRFLLDAGLVDQESVPYYWAIKLFDSVAVPTHVCSSELAWTTSAPCVMFANQWNLVAILDAIFRQQFNEGNKGSIIRGLTRKAEVRRLPEGNVDVKESKADVRIVIADSSSPAQRQRSKTSSKLPELPNETIDTRAGMQMRDRLVNAMIVEPEALHMVLEHAGYFRTLFSGYADERGHLRLPMMLQFCSDFRLTPNITSRDFVRESYEAATCVDVQTESEESEDSDVDAPRTAAAARRNMAGSPYDGSSRTRRKPVHGQVRRPGSKHEVTATFGLGAFVEVLLKIAIVYLGFYGNVVQQSSTTYTRMVWLITYLRYVGNHLKQSFRRHLDVGNTRAPAMELQKPLLRVLTAESTMEPPVPVWACRSRASLLHPCLGVGSSGVRSNVVNPAEGERRRVRRARPKWQPAASLVLNMNRLPNKLKRPLGKPGRGKLHRKERRDPSRSSSSDTDPQEAAASEDRPAVPQEPAKSPSPSPTYPVPPVHRRVPPRFDVGNNAITELGLSPLQELLSLEAGRPCVQGGVCTLCKRKDVMESWGHARCRGCSIVDALSFDVHPFRHLLVDWRAGVRPARIDPQPKPHELLIVRSDLTPPPPSNHSEASFRDFLQTANGEKVKAPGASHAKRAGF